MIDVVLSATGLFTPQERITNDELVDSFNRYVDQRNARQPQSDPLAYSSSDFIVKASGIKQRYVTDRSGILDPQRMRPKFDPRADEELSLQATMGVTACHEALAKARLQGSDIDAVLVASSNQQRAYPAISIEIQHALNARGFAYDLNVACSSATFGIVQAASLIRSQEANRVLVVSPEICTGHLNFRDRDSHFIFGDACTAVLLENTATTRSTDVYSILGSKLATTYSNHIRNNRGFLTRCEDRRDDDRTLLFYQQGRKVFKEVTTLVVAHIQDHLEELKISPQDLKTLWLHQANEAMNHLIARKILGRHATPLEAPIILDEYANTSSAGSIIAFHKHREHLVSGDKGALCSFGAGYSIGSLILQKA